MTIKSAREANTIIDAAISNTTLINTKIKDSRIAGGTIINTIISDSSFVNCKLVNCTISNCKFASCVFADCAITNDDQPVPEDRIKATNSKIETTTPAPKAEDTPGSKQPELESKPEVEPAAEASVLVSRLNEKSVSEELDVKSESDDKSGQ